MLCIYFSNRRNIIIHSNIIIQHCICIILLLCSIIIRVRVCVRIGFSQSYTIYYYMLLLYISCVCIYIDEKTTSTYKVLTFEQHVCYSRPKLFRYIKLRKMCCNIYIIILYDIVRIILLL